MRINLVNDSIETQVDDLARQVAELKTAQYTNQNSGMYAYLNRAQLYDDYGDIVDFSTTSDATERQLSRIPCPATPNTSTSYSIDCYNQIFLPEHRRPAVAIPFIELAVDSDGLYGQSEFIIDASGMPMVFMRIYNASNVEVGSVSIAQYLGQYLAPTYIPTIINAWKSTITYSSTVPFQLSYKLLVRSTDEGITSTKMRGSW